MDIKNRSVLILGGWGLVGSAICHKLIEEKPRKLIVTSLLREEAEEAVANLKKEFPKSGKDFFVPWWGNIFVRHELKDRRRDEILDDAELRRALMEDTLEELTEKTLRRSTIFQLVDRFKPDIIIDSINSATAIAYQDIFQGARDTVRQMKKAKLDHQVDDFFVATERLLCTLYIPQLIRHVQLLYQAMHACKTKIYLKIGTSGTGGMGLNIPYTHSEERPSSVLLSKSSVAGAHTMLLFLMGRTPDAPITKEVKPTAAIAWKKVGYGEVRRRGKPIQLVDCPPSKAVTLKDMLQIRMPDFAKPLHQNLKSVFIDTGENGVFSRGEFQAITSPGQMEFVTPEEIAENVVFEIKGGNTGHDIINALDNATLSPTYRAGYLFEGANKAMVDLEREHGVDSIAFEVLGPPRLSKLLHEAYLLKHCFNDMKTVAKTNAAMLCRKLVSEIETNRQLRAQIVSIGIPILLPDGKTLLRGNEIKIPPFQGENEIRITPKHINLWAHDGWVDLRKQNMEKWKIRFKEITRQADSIPPSDSSSRYMYTRAYWDHFKTIEPGKLVGWIFNYEEQGMRMKA